jgi:hypothetical protein
MNEVYPDAIQVTMRRHFRAPVEEPIGGMQFTADSMSFELSEPGHNSFLRKSFVICPLSTLVKHRIPGRSERTRNQLVIILANSGSPLVEMQTP